MYVWNNLNQPGPFAGLKTLQYGDRVTIEASGSTYTYEVRENRLLLPGSVEKAFEHEEYDWVTLLTCQMYNPLTDGYLLRRLARAVLVSVD